MVDLDLLKSRLSLCTFICVKGNRRRRRMRSACDSITQSGAHAVNTKVQPRAGRNSLQSLVIALGLALLSCSVPAAPPNPPVITALDDQEVGHPNPDGRYSLEDAIRGLPFTVNTPIPPQVVAEQVVTPSTLGNYINNPGMRLILEPGNYGNRTFNSQDQQIVLRDGVYFGNVSIGGSARRISIRNEVPRSGNMTTISMPEGEWNGFPQDILIDGVRSDDGGNRNFVNGTRIAFLNSFIRSVDFPLSAFNGQHSDIIIANCNLEAYGSTQAGPRFHTVNRFVVVDSRVNKTGSNHHSFRLHAGDGADIEHAYIGRNQISDAAPVTLSPQGTGTPTSDNFINIWFEDNDVHIRVMFDSAFVQTGQPDQVAYLWIRNNRFYGPAPNITSHGVTRPGWTIDGNSIGSYQSPPAWDFR